MNRNTGNASVNGSFIDIIKIKLNKDDLSLKFLVKLLAKTPNNL